MQAIILAGGMGTRLRPLTYTLPKPMLPIAGRPALVHIVESLAEAQCDEVIITTNYLAELIEDNLSRLNLPIPVRCVKEDKPLGTAGCIKNLIDDLDDEFIVVQGDAVADIDYRAFLRSHRERQADVSLAVMRVGDTREFGICETDEWGRILRFQEKPRPEEAFSNLANAGFYILSKNMFEQVPAGIPFDFGRQLFPALMEQGCQFYAWELSGFWIDIGRINNYLKGNMYMIEGRSSVAPDVVIPEGTTLIAPYIIGPGAKIGAKCTLGPGVVVGAHCSIGDDVHVTNSVLFDNVALGSKSRLTECVIGAGSRLGRDVTIEPLAVVGQGCEVGNGVQVGAHSRVGPVTPVAAGTLIEGVIEPRLQRLNGLQRIAVAGPVMEKLMPDEREVYALLAEYGEMTARDIAETSTLSLLRVMTVLHSLEKQDLALSTQDHPRRYALTSEEQNLPRRILIVDDAQELRDLMRLMFTTQGHSLRTASDGIEAVEAVRDERFDAIIMDAEMPNLNGWDATRLIRGMPNGRNVPVVIYTGYTGNDSHSRAHEVGASSVLNKSVLPEEMLPQVLQLIGK